MDFAAELQKLIDTEHPPLMEPLAELAAMQARLLEGIKESGGNLSLQVEEIYDIVKESDENVREIKVAAKREGLLLSGLINMTDLLDDLLPYIGEHAGIADMKKDEIINACGLELLGYTGERLNPRLHTAASAEHSEAPPETIIRVLKNGFAYNGKIIRKAAVILSKGAENA